MQRLLNEANTSEKRWCQTKFEKRHGSLIWKICGFSLCSLGNSKCLKSSIFRISGEFDDWQVELYPNGKNEESREFISVRLVLLNDNHDDDRSSDDELLSKDDLSDIKFTTYSISVVTASGEKVHVIEFSYEDQKGKDKYIARKDLLASKDLLPNDHLTISCVLTVTNRTKTEGTSDSMCSKLLHMNSRFVQHNLSNDLAQLLIRETHSDMVLKVHDYEFRVHKALLAARSSYFKCMFHHPMVESATNTVTINDVDLDVMKELLSFVYTDSCSYSSVDFALKILSAADKYNIPALELHCEVYLNSNVTADSVFHVLVAADTYGVPRLRRKCIDFICRELSYLVTLVPDWKSQFNSCPSVLCEILEQLANERLRSVPNLTNISTTHDTIRTNESKTSEYYKRKLSGHYQTAINDANREIASLKEALQTIHEIRAIRYEKRQSSRNTDGPKETIRRGTLMNLLSQNGMNLPLWIGKKNEPAPPLCGAMPAEQNYVAKIGDMVAALVKITDDEETWILAEVTQYNHSAKMYEVDDIDEDQKERYVLRHKRVIPLPLLRANPKTNNEALFPRGTLVLALYPRTTCFYRALVEEPPSKPHEQYQLSFEDSGYDGGYSPPLTVSQRYVISNAKR